MWKKIKQWIFSVKASWIGLTLFSIPLFSFTFLQITFQPTLVINVNNIPGVDGERSKNPFTVHNAEGQDVRFSIWTLTADYSWAFGYDGTIDDNYPARLNDALEKLPLSQQQRDGLNSAEEIICIGASSQESKAGLNNTDEGRRIEEARAGRRADSIVGWIRPELIVPVKEPDSYVVRLLKNIGVMRILEYFAGPPTPMPERKITPLNIGQWENPQQNKKREETGDQRRVIVILVLRNEKGEYVRADKTALQNAFLIEANNGSKIYQDILNKYSKTRNGSAWENRPVAK